MKKDITLNIIRAIAMGALFSATCYAGMGDLPDRSKDASRGNSAASEDAATWIQAELNANNIVRLRDGVEYVTDRPIQVSSNQAIVGSGIIVPDFEPGSMDAEQNSAISISGKNVIIDGLTIKKPFVDGSYGIGVRVKPGSEGVSLRNLKISGYSARYGIFVVESSSIEITGCTVSDFMMNTTADMILDSPAGISIKRCRNGIVSNNQVLRIENGPIGRASISPVRPGYGAQGYQSDNIFISNSTGFSVVGNVMETSGEGLDMLLSSDCTVTGNIIRDIWFQGIKMLGASSTAVSGNFISNSYQGIGLSDHPSYGAECENNSITGNVILNTGTSGTFGVKAPSRVNYSVPAGINIGAASRNNIIANNVIRNTDLSAEMSAPILTNKENNLVKDNLTSAGQ